MPIETAITKETNPELSRKDKMKELRRTSPTSVTDFLAKSIGETSAQSPYNKSISKTFVEKASSSCPELRISSISPRRLGRSSSHQELLQSPSSSPAKGSRLVNESNSMPNLSFLRPPKKDEVSSLRLLSPKKELWPLRALSPKKKAVVERSFMEKTSSSCPELRIPSLSPRKVRRSSSFREIRIDNETSSKFNHSLGIKKEQVSSLGALSPKKKSLVSEQSVPNNAVLEEYSFRKSRPIAPKSRKKEKKDGSTSGTDSSRADSSRSDEEYGTKRKTEKGEIEQKRGTRRKSKRVAMDLSSTFVASKKTILPDHHLKLESSCQNAQQQNDKSNKKTSKLRMRNTVLCSDSTPQDLLAQKLHRKRMERSSKTLKNKQKSVRASRTQTSLEEAEDQTEVTADLTELSPTGWETSLSGSLRFDYLDDLDKIMANLTDHSSDVSDLSCLPFPGRVDQENSADNGVVTASSQCHGADGAEAIADSNVSDHALLGVNTEQQHVHGSASSFLSVSSSLLVSSASWLEGVEVDDDEVDAQIDEDPSEKRRGSLTSLPSSSNHSVSSLPELQSMQVDHADLAKALNEHCLDGESLMGKMNLSATSLVAHNSWLEGVDVDDAEINAPDSSPFTAGEKERIELDACIRSPSSPANHLAVPFTEFQSLQVDDADIARTLREHSLDGESQPSWSSLVKKEPMSVSSNSLVASFSWLGMSSEDAEKFSRQSRQYSAKIRSRPEIKFQRFTSDASRQEYLAELEREYQKSKRFLALSNEALEEYNHSLRVEQDVWYSRIADDYEEWLDHAYFFGPFDEREYPLRPNGENGRAFTGYLRVSCRKEDHCNCDLETM